MPKRLSAEEFIEKSNKIHGSKYDYRLVEYKNNKSVVKIICKSHGEFKIIPNRHLLGFGCPVCGKTGRKNNSFFLEKARRIHGDKYGYSLVEYENNNKKVSIICKTHGIFEQRADVHLRGFGCPKCSGRKQYSSEEFIEKARQIHGDKYDYNLVEYKNNKTKIKIQCKIHGTFEQRPGDHLNCKQGCPVCKESHGEKAVRVFLEKNNIKFIYQKRFNDCKNKRKLVFDFYLPDKNTVIEFDGKQHFTENFFFNGSLEETQKRDMLKNNYCELKNVHLIRIKFNENVDSKLNHLLIE